MGGKMEHETKQRHRRGQRDMKGDYADLGERRGNWHSCRSCDRGNRTREEKGLLRRAEIERAQRGRHTKYVSTKRRRNGRKRKKRS
jgi:hypothetical protein